jgi:hypothetical protein
MVCSSSPEAISESGFRWSKMQPTKFVVVGLALYDTNEALKWKAPPGVYRAEEEQKIVDMQSHVIIWMVVGMRVYIGELSDPCCHVGTV